MATENNPSPISRRCTQCGKCLSVCPLVGATGREELSPRAKFVLEDATADVRKGSFPAGSLDDGCAARLAAMCLGCGRCRAACPMGLDAAQVAAGMRARHPGWREWLWGRWLAHPQALWPLAGDMAAAIGPFTQPLSAWGVARGLGRTYGLLRQLNTVESEIQPWLALETPRPCGLRRKAVVFAGCTARSVRPGWLNTAQALLERLGYTLQQVDFTCCGSSQAHAGLIDEASAMQQANLRAWEHAGRPQVVTFCASCHAGLMSYGQHDWSAAALDAHALEAWRASLVPLSRLLEQSVFRVLANAPAAVRYHRPCHVTGADAVAQWLRNAAGGLLVQEGREACCGFGGVLQLGAPEVSARVASRAWDFYPAAAGEQLVTGCSACVLQLAATRPASKTGVAVGHWLDSIQP